MENITYQLLINYLKKKDKLEDSTEDLLIELSNMGQLLTEHHSAIKEADTLNELSTRIAIREKIDTINNELDTMQTNLSEVVKDINHILDEVVTDKI